MCIHNEASWTVRSMLCATFGRRHTRRAGLKVESNFGDRRFKAAFFFILYLAATSASYCIQFLWTHCIVCATNLLCTFRGTITVMGAFHFHLDLDDFLPRLGNWQWIHADKPCLSDMHLTASTPISNSHAISPLRFLVPLLPPHPSSPSMYQLSKCFYIHDAASLHFTASIRCIVALQFSSKARRSGKRFRTVLSKCGKIQDASRCK